MWSNWMNRFVAAAATPDAARLKERELSRDVGDLDQEELDRDDLRDHESDGEPGDSTPIRF
jgi:hypothetical protein